MAVDCCSDRISQCHGGNAFPADGLTHGSRGATINPRNKELFAFGFMPLRVCQQILSSPLSGTFQAATRMSSPKRSSCSADFARIPKQHVANRDLKVFSAAGWAAWCFNEQPRRFLVGRCGDSKWMRNLEAPGRFQPGLGELCPGILRFICKADLHTQQSEWRSMMRRLRAGGLLGAWPARQFTRLWPHQNRETPAAAVVVYCCAHEVTATLRT